MPPILHPCAILRQVGSSDAYRQTAGTQLWQRNYWEHIVRNEPELNRIQEYIHNNPAQWELDSLNVGKGGSRTAPTEIREPITEYDMEVWMV
ncbi:hypothetical protein TRIP_B180007 [uncultured Desulfatiglans sp.]|nr:hypothetical protein TRIP_B180007 [uncultured Desulfatiglans sp.]